MDTKCIELEVIPRGSNQRPSISLCPLSRMNNSYRCFERWLQSDTSNIAIFVWFPNRGRRFEQAVPNDALYCTFIWLSSNTFPLFRWIQNNQINSNQAMAAYLTLLNRLLAIWRLKKFATIWQFGTFVRNRTCVAYAIEFLRILHFAMLTYAALAFKSSSSIISLMSYPPP